MIFLFHVAPASGLARVWRTPSGGSVPVNASGSCLVHNEAASRFFVTNRNSTADIHSKCGPTDRCSARRPHDFWITAHMTPENDSEERLDASAQNGDPRSRDNGSPLPRLAYGVDETATMLGVCPKTVRRLICRGLLRPSRALRHLLISRREIDRFLEDTASNSSRRP